jgi:hypothetical protein
LKQKALELLATAYTRQKDYDKAALALIGQWNPGQKTQTKSDSGRIKHGDTISQSRMKQDTQHNES